MSFSASTKKITSSTIGANNKSTFYNTDLEARTAFVLNRRGFLNKVRDAVLEETENKFAANMLHLLGENGYFEIIARLVNDPNGKIARRAMLVMSNLFASDYGYIRNESLEYGQHMCDAVYDTLLNTENVRLRRAAAYYLANYVKFFFSKTIVRDFVTNFDYDFLFTCKDSNVTRDLLWGFRVGAPSSVPFHFLTDVIGCRDTKAKEFMPVIEILGDLAQTDLGGEKAVAICDALLYDGGIYRAKKFGTRFLREALFTLANVLCEVPAASRLLDREANWYADSEITFLTELANHEDDVVATEATHCLVNAVMNAERESILTLSEEFLSDITPLPQVQRNVSEARDRLVAFHVEEKEAELAARSAMDYIYNRINACDDCFCEEEVEATIPIDEEEVLSEIENAMNEDEDMEIDEDASSAPAPASASYVSPLWNLPCDRPDNNINNSNNNLGNEQNGGVCGDSYYVCTALDILTHNRRYNVSRAVYDLVNLVSANPSDYTPIPANLALTGKDLQTLESLGYCIGHGAIGINPLVAAMVSSATA